MPRSMPSPRYRSSRLPAEPPDAGIDVAAVGDVPTIPVLVPLIPKVVAEAIEPRPEADVVVAVVVGRGAGIVRLTPTALQRLLVKAIVSNDSQRGL